MEGPARFPWRWLHEFCLGALRWTPEAFWRASVWDAERAYEGYALANGIKKNHESSLTGEDVKELRRMIEKDRDGHA